MKQTTTTTIGGLVLVAALIGAGLAASAANGRADGLAARQDDTLVHCEDAEWAALLEANREGAQLAADYTWETTQKTGGPSYGRFAEFCELNEDGTPAGTGRQAAELRPTAR